MENIEYWGYTAEEHQVTTDDGYIITMYRIPGTATDGRYVMRDHKM